MALLTQPASAITVMTLPQAQIEVGVARSIEDLLQVVSVRSQTYMAEQDCPWAEEFDQNDLCALHLLVRKGNEPIGTLRMRFFGEFAKLERLAILPKHRREGHAAKLVAEALAIAGRKGFRRIYIHAQKDATAFWLEQGFARLNAKDPFSFLGHPYTEMIFDLESDVALGLQTSPMVLNRPEGAWDVPGPMEAGAAGMDWAAND